MLVAETQIRVYYEDTDQMGVVYYGNYARYYEIGRTEMIRQMGFTYKEIEDQKIMLPARSLTVNYLKSACYDDLLTIKTIVESLPKVKFPIKSEIYNQHGELINKGETVLVFFNAITNKPCHAPDFFIEKMKEFF
jgi:acyl-CoA thioester hydrolase